jgi:hypothetical protein
MGHFGWLQGILGLLYPNPLSHLIFNFYFLVAKCTHQIPVEYHKNFWTKNIMSLFTLNSALSGGGSSKSNLASLGSTSLLGLLAPKFLDVGPKTGLQMKGQCQAFWPNGCLKIFCVG